MDSEQIHDQSLDEEIYKKNRKRFLTLVKISVAVLIVLALGAGYLWYQSQKSYNYQKTQLEAEQKAIQEKHSQ